MPSKDDIASTNKDSDLRTKLFNVAIVIFLVFSAVGVMVLCFLVCVCCLTAAKIDKVFGLQTIL
jgi:phage shock protein PspC (stress-responsive transcriptional regulator)